MSIEVYIIRRDMSIEVCVIWGIYQTGIHTSAMSGIPMLLLVAKTATNKDFQRKRKIQKKNFLEFLKTFFLKIYMPRNCMVCT